MSDTRWGVLTARLIVALTTAGAAPACTLPTLGQGEVPRVESGVPAGVEVRELARLVNEHRVSAGCPPLRWDADLAEVAAAHSLDMERRGYFGHVTPEGHGAADRVRIAGLRWRISLGENLAQTGAGPSDAVALWLQSAPHRASLENCGYRVHGAGRAGSTWTQLLAGAIERS